MERYAWFAVSTDGFGWLGPSNSLMDLDTLQLTPLGELYLGRGPQHQAGAGGRQAAAGGKSGQTVACAAGVGVSSTQQEQGQQVEQQQQHGRSGHRQGEKALRPSSYKTQQAGGWEELCQPCIQHLEGGGSLDTLDPQRRRYCSHSCGFWPSPEDFPPRGHPVVA